MRVPQLSDSPADPSAVGPLNGVTVIEMGNFIAAPSAGRLLAEFGATVIKIERPRGGDELRSWRSYNDETSLLFRLIGRNKKSITLDLRSERGQDIARHLLRSADVLLENFRPGTLERWGLGPDALQAENPQLIVTRISGYGQSGPYRDRVGFGGVAEALSGIRGLAGYPGMPPVRVGVSLADSLAGLYAVIGTLMSLLHRNRGDGAGEVVDVALYEAAFSLTESLLPDYEAFGVTRGPSGSTVPGVVPSNSYPCADGRYVVIGGNSNGIFQRLMQLIDRRDLAEAADLQHNQGRVARATEIEEAISTWTATRSLDEATNALDEAAVPCGPIYTASEIATDPHFESRAMRERRHVDIGEGQQTEVSFPGVVPKLSRRPGAVTSLGPELGAHTAEVLAGLGFEATEREQLRADGVI